VQYSLLINEATSESDSDTSEEFESNIVSSSSSESENEDKRSVRVEDYLEKNDSETNDDEVPLYEGAKVSELSALIIVMLICLSGQALIDLVLCALLPDGHKRVSSA